MAYRALINSSLARAYRIASDLAVPVTFTRRVTDFSFGTLETSTAATPIVTKAIVADAKKPSGERDVSKKELMFKSKGLGDTSLFDTVTIAGEVWKVGAPIHKGDFITILSIFKE